MKRQSTTRGRTRAQALPMLAAVIGLIMVAGCGQSMTRSDPAPTPAWTTVDTATLTPVDGQRLYVPAYSEIYYADSERTWDFAITLAIHNTDEAAPIVVDAIRYYNRRGELVADYSTEPFQLPPLATHTVTVPRDDRRGGVGANFVVDWVAESQVNDPVVEAVMISAAGQQGLSFVITGRVIEEWGE